MRSRRCCRLRDPPAGRRAGLADRDVQTSSESWKLEMTQMTHPSLGKLEMTQMTHPSLGKLEMTHQIGIRNTLHEERFYADGALVIASSLRNTEIKQILSVWSLQAFLRLLGRFREMTRGLDRQNTLFNTKMQKHRHGGIPL